MGKQITVITTHEDCDIFWQYIKEKYKCVLYKSFANTKESLIVNDLSSSFTISIWNSDFSWRPEYKQTITDEKLFYISNKGNAPLIEFSNTNWNDLRLGKGRIYWAKYFSSSEVDYDVEKFELFYKDLEKWLIKNSVHKDKYSGKNDYYLYNAWEKMKNMQVT